MTQKPLAIARSICAAVRCLHLRSIHEAQPRRLAKFYPYSREPLPRKARSAKPTWLSAGLSTGVVDIGECFRRESRGALFSGAIFLLPSTGQKKFSRAMLLRWHADPYRPVKKNM
ncbi:MAG: hypothetical protein ACREP7_23785 [Lysobacter sp.]